MFEHEVEACRETDTLIHELLGKTGEPPPYSSDEAVAEALAKEVGLTVIPVHETNYTHFFDSLGILPEGEPVGYLGVLELELDEISDNLLLQHGWWGLSEANTLPLAVCRSILLHKEVVRPTWVAGGVPAGACLVRTHRKFG